MILRLVCSFFFFSLVTGNQRGRYGYPAHGLINSVHSINPQSRIENSYDMEIVSDEGSNLQLPRPIQYVEEDSEYGEKTICFTPSMVHKMIKAALEYVSKMPSDINNIVENLDQELNIMPDTEIEENAVKPLYPLDSKTIFQMVDKPRSEVRTNLILKYELPSVKEPHCREALEKLIEIAFTAYQELEQHPQCHDYLYNFAAHQPGDRPTGHLDQGPDLKSLIASILDQVDKRRPNHDINSPGDRFGDMPVADVPTPNYNIPQVQEYNTPQQPQKLEYNVPNTIHKNGRPEPEYNAPLVPDMSNEYNVPHGYELNKPEYNVPHGHELNKPEYIVPHGHELNKPEYNIPHGHELNKPEYNVPHGYELNKPEYNIPHSHELNQPEYNVPQSHELNKPEYIVPHSHELNKPEYNIPQSHELNKPEYIVPHSHELNKPEYNVPHGYELIKPEYIGPHGQDLIKPEYNGPHAHDLIKPKYNVPNIHEYNINEFNVPKVHEYSITQTHEYNVPQINEFVTQSHEYTIPKVHEYSVTHEYNVPNVYEYSVTHNHEYNIPQIPDIIIPQVQSIEMPDIQDTTLETIEEIVPMNPEETFSILIKLLENDHSGNLIDRLMTIIEENQNNFHPRIFKLLLTLLNSHKRNKIPKFNDIFILLLNSQRKPNGPANDRVKELLLSYLIPDQNGYLDSRIVDIVLNLNEQNNEKLVEYILSLLRPIKEGKVDTKTSDIILKLINLSQHNSLRPEDMEIILKLLKPSQNGNANPVDVDVADNLARWNEMGGSPQTFNGLIELLKPYTNGHPDRRPIDIIHLFFTNARLLNPKHISFILNFLYPENGVLDVRRIDIMHFLMNNLPRNPKSTNILLTLLQENGPAVLNSRFLDILLLLNSNGLLTPELVETVINLLANEVIGQLEDHQVKTLFFQLAPFKQSKPKLVVDVLTLLTQGGMHGNIVEWLETVNNNVALPNRDSKPPHVHEDAPQENKNEYRTPDGGYQIVDAPSGPDNDFMAIFKWLDSQGLLTKDQGSNADLVNKILNILQVGQRELGVVELTYMLKHEKPLIYQPVYYVKYRLPILSFISNMKTLLLENPNLNADPMKLLQELIVISNVTEVSPNLQGFPKEEILKLTFNDGDLVQAKILDEQNLSLNEQITYVHGLNSDISPEEILQLNKINEAKYFPKLLEIKGRHPEQITIKEVDKFIDVPPVHYRHLELPAAVSHQTHQKTKTIHTRQTYISRQQPKEVVLNSNAQLRSQQ